MHFTEHLVDMFRKSSWKSDLNHEYSSFLIQQLKSMTGKNFYNNPHTMSAEIIERVMNLEENQCCSEAGGGKWTRPGACSWRSETQCLAEQGNPRALGALLAQKQRNHGMMKRQSLNRMLAQTNQSTGGGNIRREKI
jgi:hypothetical protein